MLKSNVPKRILGVIPARFASTRFPGKALASLAGKTILQHVFERAKEARYLTQVIIATDDERIADAARSFRAPVRMTRADHASGSDRVAEVASTDTAEIIVNIQGDEPLIAFDNEHFLETLGYVVVATIDNAPEADKLIAAGGIDLILADVNLNGGSGRDVALAARAVGIPVLFVTASCPVDAPEIAIGCLAKPYAQKALRLAIEAVDAFLESGERPKRLPKGLTLYEGDGA